MSELGWFQPVVPKLKITKIDSQEEIKRIGELLRTRIDVFHGFGNVQGSIRVRQGRVYIPSSDPRSEDRTLLSLGDYLIVSENGLHYITSDPVVKHGVFRDFPTELFVPVEGIKETDSSF